MSTLQSTSAPASRLAPSSGTATAVVRGQQLTIPCPSWCIRDHAAEGLLFLEDLSHVGEEVAIAVPVHGGAAVEALGARLAWWPFAGEGAPYVALDADGGDVTGLSRSAAGAFADQLEAHARRLRRLADAL